MSAFNKSFVAIFIAVLGALALAMSGSFDAGERDQRTSRIIQGSSLADVVLAVEQAGGEITHELGIINAVAADLDRAVRWILDQTD